MNDRSKILKIIAVIAAIAAVTAVIYVYRRQIRDFLSKAGDKLKKLAETPVFSGFTKQEYEDFADI